MKVRVGRKEINAEVARGWKKYVGYMFRKEPSFEQGMMFVFNRPKRIRLWSLFVNFPLEVLFLDKRFRIKKIAFLKAWDLKGVECKKAKYALEVKKGFCKKFKIKTGMKVNPSELFQVE